MSCYPLQVVSRMVMNRSGEVFYIGGNDVLPAPLEPKREAFILQKLGTGQEEEAKSVLIEHNLRLVVYIAKKFDTNNIPNMTKQDIIDSIPDDWNYTEHNGFVHIRDADGDIRIRIDPPDKVTQYPHVHAYDSVGNLLDSVGNIVDRKSPDGHIPYKDN